VRSFATKNIVNAASALIFIAATTAVAGGDGNYEVPNRQALFGGLHVHTSWSLDTAQLGLLTGPEDAYRFALGEPITHVTGEQIQLTSGPLDFLAVTEHSEYMAMGRSLGTDADSPINGLDYIRQLQGDDAYTAVKLRMGMVDSITLNEPIAELVAPKVRAYPWQKLIEMADQFYKPNEFTTLVGFEWTAAPDDANLHRVVLFGNESNLPAYPLSAFDTEEPSGLWNWLDKLRGGGARVLAIPHNSNISDGRMFPTQGEDGARLGRAYAEQRMRNEPLVEIMQVKGASETHPALSPNDEWAGFAINDVLLTRGTPGSGPKQGQVQGSYMREAWLEGLRLANESGSNPYRFGVVASSDTHSTAGTYEEANYFGSKGINDSTPELRLTLTYKPPPASVTRRRIRTTLAASMRRQGSGLAGVWAEANTRESIFAALGRKETFGTSGPRIRVRVFGGWDFTMADLADEQALVSAGYARGVPMGGDLPARPDAAPAPRLLVQARMDPNSAPLQRLQIIKGWLEDGVTREAVYDVACAGGVQPDADTSRCPDNGARVDLEDCSFAREDGAAGLTTVWRDPDFDARSPAFYYVRVLENPTCRWSTWDAVRLNVAAPDDVPAAIQERAWTSPVWYVPER
jgi:hypothetical protein